MPIPYPVTQTKISTSLWGIPITDAVNANTTFAGNASPRLDAIEIITQNIGAYRIAADVAIPVATNTYLPWGTPLLHPEWISGSAIVVPTTGIWFAYFNVGLLTSYTGRIIIQINSSAGAIGYADISCAGYAASGIGGVRQLTAGQTITPFMWQAGPSANTIGKDKTSLVVIRLA